MIVLDTVALARKALDELRAAGRNVGFVPTMGALHAGHASLVRRARSENDAVCLSIFVNPAQFGPREDFDAYPRPVDDDLELCRQLGVDVVFHPSADEMYAEAPVTRIVVGGLGERLEGAFRPGHFEGVALVVAKLFGVVGPCRAYFGEKDAQQLRVVRRLVADLSIAVEVVGCPTVRDGDGLALSSRNAYLTPEERTRALALPNALFAMRAAAEGGEAHAAALLACGRAVLRGGVVDAVDYLEIVHPETFEPVERLDAPSLACGAVRVGGTRLIDNVRIG